MKQKLILLVILILGLSLRLYGINWDSGFHLHPDERFLTMVSNAMIWPKNLKEYFDPTLSKLNPGNIGNSFFVYGVFPLTLTKFFAINFGFDDYHGFTLLGRFLSALFDFLIIFLVYKSVDLLVNDILKINKRNVNKDYVIPLFASLFYAVSVYPIQSSHFFTTDTFLNFFMFGSFYFALRFYGKSAFRLSMIFFSALFFGLALSSKISAIYILPLNLILILITVFIRLTSKRKKIITNILYLAFCVMFYFLITYLVLRLSNPYYFGSDNFFDFRLNQNFVSSIQSLKSFSNKEVWYPPAIQWINKPWWGLLSTTILVGLGPVNFIAMLTGIIWLLKNLKLKVKNSKLQLKIKNEEAFLFLISFWVVGYFVYQSLQFVKSIRYTIYLYPFFAIFGGFGMFVVLNLIKSQIDKNKTFCFFQDKLIKKVIQSFIFSTFYFLLLLWPLLFFTIYLNKNTRVQASEWIYQNLANNSIILGEHWDDPLPLPIEDNFGKNFQVDLLPIFDPDTSEKWNKMKELLSKADYYVLSSNRGWGSIPTVPERYPIMSQYYKSLLNNDCQEQIKITGVCYKKIKEFLPYYYKFIRYPDSWIEETFTVYDHQTVLIYERVR